MLRHLRRVSVVAAVSAAATFGLAGLITPGAGAADPVGYTILRGEGCSLAQVNLVTGAITPIGTDHLDSCVSDLEFSPDGSTLYGIRFSGEPIAAHLVTFNLTTGVTTDLGVLGSAVIVPFGGGNLTFAADGKPYTFLAAPLAPTAASCAALTLCIDQINLSTLALTLVNSVPQFNTQYLGLATSCGGATMSIRDTGALQTDVGGKSIVQTLTTVNLTSTGAGTTDVGPITPQRVASLDFDSAGNLYATGYDETNSSDALYKINPATGATTFVADLTNTGTKVNVGAGPLAIYHPCTAPTTTTTTTTTTAPVAILPAFTG